MMRALSMVSLFVASALPAWWPALAESPTATAAGAAQNGRRRTGIAVAKRAAAARRNRARAKRPTSAVLKKARR